VVPDVLSGVEDPEGQAVEEVTGGEEAHDRPESEACALPQEPGDVLELGNVVLSVPTVLDQQREDEVVLLARVGWEQSRQLLEHNTPETKEQARRFNRHVHTPRSKCQCRQVSIPCGNLVLGVVDLGNGVATERSEQQPTVGKNWERGR